MRNHPSTKQILKSINKLERHINRWKMVPAVHYLRSRVILPLLSKSLTVGKAVCALIDAGYPAEAFATSRTLLELVFTVHYITNKDMEKRAERYVKYQAHVQVEWMKIARKHFPAKAAKLRPLSPHILAMAKELPDNVHLPVASALARVLGRFMPFWYILVFLLTLAEVLFQWHQSSRLPIWIATSAVLWALASVYSITALVPINNRIASWEKVTPPADWKTFRNRWDLLHRWRVVLLTIAFAFLIVGGVSR